MKIVRIIVINLLILLALFVPVELATRVYGYFFVVQEKAFQWRNYSVDENIDVIQGDIYPAVRDPLLGFLPKPGRIEGWKGETLTVGEGFIRSNGQPPPLAPRPLIVAAGDSFTYGDQVSDHQTWVAALERLIAARVLNAGVFDYGIGQSYLRARQLVERLKPDGLIIGMIPHDIRRVEMSARMGTAKPMFHLVDGQLTMTTAEENARRIDNPANRAREEVIRVARQVLGYSFLLHHVLLRTFPEAWRSSRFSIVEHDQGVAVSCALMARIAALPVAEKVLFVQYPAHLVIAGKREEDLLKVMACARTNGIEVVDLFQPLRAALARDKLVFAELFKGHMSARGNAFAATELLHGSAALRRLQARPRTAN